MNRPNFKVGDVVICVNDNLSPFIHGRKYKILSECGFSSTGAYGDLTVNHTTTGQGGFLVAYKGKDKT